MKPQTTKTRTKTEHGTIHAETLSGGWTWQWISARSAQHAQRLMDELGWRSVGNAESETYSRATYDPETKHACLYFNPAAAAGTVIPEIDLDTLPIPF